MAIAHMARAGVACLFLGASAFLAGCASGPSSRGPSGSSASMLPEPSLNANPGYQAANESKTGASQAPPARASDDLAAEMRPNAPARYVVHKGDTLWAIAGYYLKSPWLWPQLWHANPDIGDPNLIYPGDVLVLSRSIDGTPRLTRVSGPSGAASGGDASGGTIKLSPKVRVLPLSDAIPVLPADAIRAFLRSPRRVDIHTLSKAPYVVALGGRQLIAGTGTPLYIRDLPAHHAKRYELVRAGDKYRDPKTDKILGRAAIPVGQVIIERDPSGGQVAVARLTTLEREAQVGDRLLPVQGNNLVRDFHPRTPAAAVQTHILSVFGGFSQIGQYDVVALADEHAPRLSRGDVLDIYQAGRTVEDEVNGGEVKLPEQHAGRLMVFKNEGDISYAIVMNATRAIHVGDIARSPNAS